MRFAGADDLVAIRAFAHRVVGPYYASLGLPEFGEKMVAQYWNSDVQTTAVREGRVIVALDDDDRIVGVAEFGDYDGDVVLWKLYVDESCRGTGVGRALLDRVVEIVSARTDTLLIEHAAENEAAGEIYDRWRFEVVRIDQGEGPGGTTVWRRKRL